MPPTTEPSALVQRGPLTLHEERLAGILLAKAEGRQTATYGGLGKLLGLNMAWARDRERLGEMLCHVGSYSLATWGVMLNVIAVSGKDGLPSGRLPSDPSGPSGFWSWAETEGYNISDPRGFVHEEQARLFGMIHKASWGKPLGARPWNYKQAATS